MIKVFVSFCFVKQTVKVSQSQAYLFNLCCLTHFIVIMYRTTMLVFVTVCLRAQILTVRLRNGNNSLSSSWQTTVNGRLPVPVTLVNNTLIESVWLCHNFRGGGGGGGGPENFSRPSPRSPNSSCMDKYMYTDTVLMKFISIAPVTWSRSRFGCCRCISSNLICSILQTSTPVDFWTQIEMQLSSSVLHACCKVQPRLWTPFLRTWLYMDTVMPLKGYFWSPCTCLPESPLLVSRCQHPP